MSETNTHLKKALTEIKALANPPAPLISTLSATFILLGYSEDYVKVWRNIQRLLADSATLSKMCDFQAATCKTDVALSVRKMLDTCTHEKIKNVSRAGSVLYNWTTRMLEEVEKCGIQGPEAKNDN